MQNSKWAHTQSILESNHLRLVLWWKLVRWCSYRFPTDPWNWDLVHTLLYALILMYLIGGSLLVILGGGNWLLGSIIQIISSDHSNLWLVLGEVVQHFSSYWHRDSWIPSLALVPVSLQTRGTLRSTICEALMIPSAMMLHFMIPPKILIKMVFTLGWLLRISKAVFTCSTLAPPPTSKKLAGSPL